MFVGPSGIGNPPLEMIEDWKNDEGEIYIDEIDQQSRVQSRDIAMVFQNYALSHMNVYDNMAFPLKQRRVPKPKSISGDRNRKSGVRGFEKKTKALSGGERRRVPWAVPLFAIQKCFDGRTSFKLGF